MVGTAKYTIMENQNQSPPIDVNNTKKTYSQKNTKKLAVRFIV